MRSMMFFLMTGAILSLSCSSQASVAQKVASVDNSGSGAGVAVIRDNTGKIEFMVNRDTLRGIKSLWRVIEHIMSRSKHRIGTEEAFAVADQIYDANGNVKKNASLFGVDVQFSSRAQELMHISQSKLRESVPPMTQEYLEAQRKALGDKSKYDVCVFFCSLSEAEEIKQKFETIRQSAESEARGKHPSKVKAIFEAKSKEAIALIERYGVQNLMDKSLIIKNYPAESLPSPLDVIVQTANSDKPHDQRYPLCVFVEYPGDGSEISKRTIAVAVLGYHGQGLIENQRILRGIVDQKRRAEIRKNLLVSGQKLFEVNVTDSEILANDSDIVMSISGGHGQTLSLNLAEFKALALKLRNDSPENHDSIETFVNTNIDFVKEIVILAYYKINDPLSLLDRLQIASEVVMDIVKNIIQDDSEVKKAYDELNDFTGKMFNCSMVKGPEDSLSIIRQRLAKVHEEAIKAGKSDTNVIYEELISAALVEASKNGCKVEEDELLYDQDINPEFKAICSNIPNGGFTRVTFPVGTPDMSGKNDGLIIIMKSKGDAKKPDSSKVAKIMPRILVSILEKKFGEVTAQWKKTHKLEMLASTAQKSN